MRPRPNDVGNFGFVSRLTVVKVGTMPTGERSVRPLVESADYFNVIRLFGCSDATIVAGPRPIHCRVEWPSLNCNIFRRRGVLSNSAARPIVTGAVGGRGS